MRAILLFAFMCLFLISITANGQNPQSPDTLKKVVDTVYKRMWWKERSCMFFVNTTRLLTLHQPLIGKKRLGQDAFSHSKNMAKTGRFGHYGFEKRRKSNGFRAENVMKGNRSAFGVFWGWLTSKKHRKNMLSWRYWSSGIGLCKRKIITRWYTKHNEVVKKTVNEQMLYGTHVFR